MGIQKIPIDLISVPRTQEGALLTVQAGKVAVSAGTKNIPSEVIGGSFDDAGGVLTLQFANGVSLPIKGFPSIGDIPAGRQGQEGPTGKDGKDGRDGRDGAVGGQGCTGPVGPDGGIGPVGPDGRPGLPGPQGRRGLTGADGDQGKRGRTGPTGSTGNTGPTGATGPTGPDGIPGPVGTMRIIVSTIDPGGVPVGTIWINPNIGRSKTWPEA